MNDWLENFSFAGIKLTEGEKSLMRFAMSKECERIIKLLKSKRCECLDLEGDELMALIRKDERLAHMNCEWVGLDWVIELVEGEQK